MDTTKMSALPVPTTLKLGPLQQHSHAYDLMRQCIHCGFCLPTCPTYAVLGVEMDSPRGRIYQMQAIAEGRVGISDEFIDHMNCCLGCRACETACPSGVQYGKLIEAAREQIQLEFRPAPLGSEQIESQHTLHTATNRTAEPLLNRLLKTFFFDLMLPSRLLTTLIFTGLKIYQRTGLQALVHKIGLLDLVDSLPTPLKGKLSLPEKLMPQASGPLLPTTLPEITPALGVRKYRVGFVSGCIMDQVFRDINEASIRVLTASGCEVVSPHRQGCCGALHVHAGEAEKGRELARRNINTFERYDLGAIIINSAGCGSTLKEYGHLLRDDPQYAERAEAFSAKVKDISEFLFNIEWNQQMGELPYVASYHDACHLAHGQKIKQQPRQLLKQIPGLKMVDLKEADWCCGSAGIYNIVNQEMGNTLLDRKIANIIASGAHVIVTGNPGCMMQIALGAREKGLDLRVVHPIQLLDEAYKKGGVYPMTQPTENNREISPIAQPVENNEKRRRNLFFIGLAVGVITTIIRARRLK